METMHMRAILTTMIAAFALYPQISCEQTQPLKRDLLVQNEINRIMLHLPKSLKASDLSIDEQNSAWESALNAYPNFRDLPKSELLIQAILGFNFKAYKEAIRTGTGFQGTRLLIVQCTFKAMNAEEKRDFINVIIPQLEAQQADAGFMYFAQMLLMDLGLHNNETDPPFRIYDDCFKTMVKPPDILIKWMYLADKKGAVLALSRVYGKRALTSSDLKDQEVLKRFVNGDQWWEQLYSVYSLRMSTEEGQRRMKVLKDSKHPIVQSAVKDLIAE